MPDSAGIQELPTDLPPSPDAKQLSLAEFSAVEPPPAFGPDTRLISTSLPIVEEHGLDWQAVRSTANYPAVRARMHAVVQQMEALLDQAGGLGMLFDADRLHAGDRVINVSAVLGNSPRWIIGDLHSDLLAPEAALAQIRDHAASGETKAPRPRDLAAGRLRAGKASEVDRPSRSPRVSVELVKRADPEKREDRFDKQREDRFDEPSEALHDEPVLPPPRWPDVLRDLARTRRMPSAMSPDAESIPSTRLAGGRLVLLMVFLVLALTSGMFVLGGSVLQMFLPFKSSGPGFVRPALMSLNRQQELADLAADVVLQLGDHKFLLGNDVLDQVAD